MTRKIVISALIVMLVLIVSVIFAFNRFEKQPPASNFAPIEDIHTPIWKNTELDLYEVVNKYVPNTIYVYDITVSEKPKFYNGPMPLRYSIGYPTGGLPGYSQPTEKPLFYNYSESITYFVYSGRVIIGAQTQDKEGHIIAEVSNVIFTIENHEQIVEIEEHHYRKDGQTIFKCTGQIDPYTGHKLRENGRIGTKQSDYYFLWPKL
jgi:hypothetical protein